MVTSVHVRLSSSDPEADRAFFRDVLQFRAVDVGGGWLIFALPPAEAAVHPMSGNEGQLHAGHRLLGAVIYLMCDDLRAFIKSLEARRVHCTAISEEPWGIKTTIPLPSGGEIGLYQPLHETARHLDSR